MSTRPALLFSCRVGISSLVQWCELCLTDWTRKQIHEIKKTVLHHALGNTGKLGSSL